MVVDVWNNARDRSWRSFDKRSVRGRADAIAAEQKVFERLVKIDLAERTANELGRSHDEHGEENG